MHRRKFLTILGAAAFGGAPAASAQSPSRVYRLGTISPGSPVPAASPSGKVLVGALAQHGFTLGQNLTVEARGAMGEVSKLPQLFAELKALNVDAIVCLGYPTALVAKGTKIPTVVAFGAGDPVATGLVSSLAHPGGNITGISDVASTLTTKRLALLKEVSPRLRRVAMLWNKDDRGMTLRYDASAQVAQSIGITIQALGVRAPDDFNEAFTAMDKEPPDAILMVSDSPPRSTANGCLILPRSDACRRSTSTTSWSATAA